MTHEQLAEGICSNCCFLEWKVDEDSFGRRFVEVIGCLKDVEPFYNKGCEALDCAEWKARMGNED